MILALTCALCAAPMPPSGAPLDGMTLLDGGLEIRDSPRPPRAAPVLLALAGMPDGGPGDGADSDYSDYSDHSDHSGHMGPMWILMGAMMAVMMVGMGVYFMRHSAPGHPLAAGSVTSPAQLALPVSVGRGGGG